MGEILEIRMFLRCFYRMISRRIHPKCTRCGQSCGLKYATTLHQAVRPTMKRRTSCTQRPKSRMPIPRTTCASTFCVMFGGKQGHYARWHVRLWVSLPCRLSPAELGVRCFTVNGVEHVIYQFISFVDDISLAVACFFLLPGVPSQGSNDTRSISCFMYFQSSII